MGAAEPRAVGQSVQDFLKEVELIGLPDSVATLTEHFARVGYQTLGIGANINFSEALGFSRGFERFWHREDAPAEDVAAALEEWADEVSGDRPSFLYLHLNDVHRP